LPALAFAAVRCLALAANYAGHLLTLTAFYA
jgi:hypothetical protein